MRGRDAKEQAWLGEGWRKRRGFRRIGICDRVESGNRDRVESEEVVVVVVVVVGVSIGVGVDVGRGVRVAGAVYWTPDSGFWTLKLV